MLNKNIPIPLYYQLKEKLTQMIQNGEMPVGSLVPSERELSERYGISRMTVRQALGELVKEGLLVREQGKGTFVAEPKINQGLLKLTSFSEDMRSRGMEPDSRVKAIYVQEAPPMVASALGLSSEKRVVIFERVRLADNKPMALEISHLPLAKFPELDKEDLHSASLYKLLEDKYNVSIHHARQTIEVGLSSSVESKYLGIRSKSPVLLIERITFDAKDQPFEFVKSVYRGDRYKLQVELYR
ncbi:GntR family transcriptional regulator [Effusibacillus lacus]|uniref:GntR family transcriptional regulator n=1 Tax=Effusibacillus lacus TaxID=1348429 RepID=A0A292YS25_9BACL|nr:GntR family transcriptional regulator [Effusibacillus lacus]